MVDSTDEHREARRRARRWALVLGVVAIAIYTAFFFLVKGTGG